MVTSSDNGKIKMWRAWYGGKEGRIKGERAKLIDEVGTRNTEKPPIFLLYMDIFATHTHPFIHIGPTT